MGEYMVFDVKLIRDIIESDPIIYDLFKHLCDRYDRHRDSCSKFVNLEYIVIPKDDPLFIPVKRLMDRTTVKEQIMSEIEKLKEASESLGYHSNIPEVREEEEKKIDDYWDTISHLLDQM